MTVTEYYEIISPDECPVCHDEITSAKAIGWVDEYGYSGYVYECRYCNSRLIDTE
jgi:hypothetical protein